VSGVIQQPLTAATPIRTPPPKGGCAAGAWLQSDAAPVFQYVPVREFSTTKNF
jgi:hypothetical protein